MKPDIPHAVWRTCAGIVEAEQILPSSYRQAISNAEQVIGQNFSPSSQARSDLIEAVKLNFVNRKKWPFELLKRRYTLPLSYNAFGKEKKKFCFALAKELGLL